MADSNTDLLKTRIKKLNKKSQIDGQCVLYIMSRDQRVRDNHALIAAQKHALAKKLPLAVVFCLYAKSGYRGREHYEWMLAGLAELEKDLASINIPFMVLIGDPYDRIIGCIKHLSPDALYFDFNPLTGPQRLAARIAQAEDCSVYMVDTHNLVPVWGASDKQEVGARTLRPKINRLLPDYLIEPEPIEKHPYDWPGNVMPIAALSDRIDEQLENLPSNGQKDLQEIHRPGESAAHQALDDFIQNRLGNYADDRNDPSKEGLSGLSPYLHFGQLASSRVALEVTIAAKENHTLQAGAEVLIEEMIVRKELSDNYCYFNQNYRSLKGAPDWSQKTLQKHAHDEREFIYSCDELAASQTHDPAWNAAQAQMVKMGKMHGYMRMYWAKKVLEWSKTPEDAIDTLIYLNDFYSIDGGDPNGYVGIMWSVSGVHDRPWGERPVYGTVRSMVYNGLKRKFDIKAYEERWLS